MHQADGVCVVAFGAEKLGLFGSQAFVATHDVSGTRLMLNFDIAGHLDGPSIVGNAGLTLETLNALAVAEELQIVAEVFQPFAFSDHVSFSEVGVPSVTITNGDDPAIHTSEDALVRISVGALETILGIVDVVLEPVAAGNQS
jgi:Zn-dependent M28 family amino/carboxypeptidase